MVSRLRVALVALALTAVAAAYGVFSAFSPDARAEVIRVENPTVVVDGLTLWQGREIVYRLRNDGKEALEVIGCDWY